MSVRIRQLDPVTAGRIAAGEVIEHPTSVVKELLDNALDAGSTRLDIELVNGGRHLIQVTDNGYGMTAAEAVLALQRFSTSKLQTIDDLCTLTTLGFRGEALPSMAAVADVELITRPAQSPEGAQVLSHGHADPEARPIGCPVGTRVRVLRLFAQVPVRLRALKSIAREVQQVQELVAHYALAHPQVTFHLQHDSRRLLFVPASADLRQRLAIVFGQELASQMLPLHWQNLDLVISGAVSPPGMHRATRQRQYIWVNGRPVRSMLVSAALERAYGALLPPGRRPLVGLGLRVPPALLDINVHPRKTEIKFLHERAIFAGVREAVEAVVQRLPAAESPWDAADAFTAWDTMPTSALSVGETSPPYVLRPADASQPTWHAVGQVGNTFIVASGPDGLLILDQHAAHESVLYERLTAADEGSIELTEPLLCSPTASQQRWLSACQPVLSSLHFQIEPFGQGTMLVRAVPVALQTLLRPGTFLEALEEAMRRLTPQAAPEVWREHLAAAFACRTAIRAGDALDEARIAALLEAVTRQHLGYTCPHGRPTHVMLSVAELERRFLRL